jgi:hypothetical protein
MSYAARQGARFASIAPAIPASWGGMICEHAAVRLGSRPPPPAEHAARACACTTPGCRCSSTPCSRCPPASARTAQLKRAREGGGERGGSASPNARVHGREHLRVVRGRDHHSRGRVVVVHAERLRGAPPHLAPSAPAPAPAPAQTHHERRGTHGPEQVDLEPALDERRGRVKRKPLRVESACSNSTQLRRPRHRAFHNSAHTATRSQHTDTHTHSAYNAARACRAAATHTHARSRVPTHRARDDRIRAQHPRSSPHRRTAPPGTPRGPAARTRRPHTHAPSPPPVGRLLACVAWMTVRSFIRDVPAPMGPRSPAYAPDRQKTTALTAHKHSCLRPRRGHAPAVPNSSREPNNSASLRQHRAAFARTHAQVP